MLALVVADRDDVAVSRMSAAISTGEVKRPPRRRRKFLLVSIGP